MAGHVSDWLDAYVTVLEGLTPTTRVESGKGFLRDDSVVEIVNTGLAVNYTEVRNFDFEIDSLSSNWEIGDPTPGVRHYEQTFTIHVLYTANMPNRYGTAKVIMEDSGQLYWALTRNANIPAEDTNGGVVQMKASVSSPTEESGGFDLPIDCTLVYWRRWS
jgi:hypothetical protein